MHLVDRPTAGDDVDLTASYRSFNTLAALGVNVAVLIALIAMRPVPPAA